MVLAPILPEVLVCPLVFVVAGLPWVVRMTMVVGVVWWCDPRGVVVIVVVVHVVRFGSPVR